MKANDQFDTDLLKQVQEYCNHLKSDHGARNTMQNEMENMFMLDWGEEGNVKEKMENVKLTKSPDARNKLLGMIRLMIATDPVWSVPYDKNNDDAKDKADKIEKLADVIWNVSGEIRQDPVHYDVVTSMLLWGETHIPITRTSDLVEAAKGGTKAAQVKAEEINSLTPVLFDVWDPRPGYPEIGPTGLTAYYREVETTSGKVLDDWGDAALVLLEDKQKRYDKVTLCQFWDYENHMVWLKSYEQPIVQEANDWGFVPITVYLGEGSRMFSKLEYWRQPPLYTLWRSGLWNRQNLMLTVYYTMIFAIGSNPMFLYKANQPKKQLNRDFSRPGGLVTIEKDEDYGPLVKQTIDPSMIDGMQRAAELVSQSTIYDQTLGQPLSGNAPYSMVALLHQAGRLPLVVPQRKADGALADAMKKALKLIKYAGGKAKAGYDDMFTEIKTSEIPDHFKLETTLEITLPQDTYQNAQTAAAVSGGEDPLVSQRWAREELLHIGQSEEMQQEIWGEKAANLKAMSYFADQLNQLKMKLEALQRPTQPTTPTVPSTTEPPMGETANMMGGNGNVPPEGLPNG